MDVTTNLCQWILNYVYSVDAMSNHSHSFSYLRLLLWKTIPWLKLNLFIMRAEIVSSEKTKRANDVRHFNRLFFYLFLRSTTQNSRRSFNCKLCIFVVFPVYSLILDLQRHCQPITAGQVSLLHNERLHRHTSRIFYYFNLLLLLLLRILLNMTVVMKWLCHFLRQ